jgi:hypothetical protein
MENNAPIKPPLLPFLAAALAPVLAFILANALFLPYVLAMFDPGSSFLSDLIPRNLPGGGYLFMSLLVLLFPILAGFVVLGPALTSLIVNLVHPILNSWAEAFLGGAVFFISHLILLIVLLVVRNEPLFPTPIHYEIPPPGIVPIINFPVDPLAIAGLLAGFVLSGSVILFGWLGARMRRKKISR